MIFHLFIYFFHNIPLDPPIPLGDDLGTLMALLQNLLTVRGNANVGRNFGLKIPKILRLQYALM